MKEEMNLPSVGTDIEIQLRWSDEDKLGHVNNARIVTLMEEARVRWLRRDGIAERFGNGLVVAATFSISCFTKNTIRQVLNREI